MTSPLLSRRALALVLQSLLTAEVNAARGGAFQSGATRHPPSGAWSEDMTLGENGVDSLGCDSLDLLRLAAAVNEMFGLYEAHLDVELFRTPTYGGWLDAIEAAWMAGVASITFRTSGTTGIPKHCTHDFAHLHTEVSFLADLFRESIRIVSLAPAHHIYGFLFTAMLPDRLGIDALAVNLMGNQPTRLGMREGDLVVAIPELWAFLSATVTEWPGRINGAVSTGPCAPGLIGSLIDSGLHSMTEIYGSTETAGIGTRRWPELRYQLMPHWTYADSDNPNHMDLVHTSGMRMPPMDQLNLHEDGFFTLGGRLDGAVQVGGTNVYPARIAALLALRPGVAHAAVRLMQPGGSQRLEACVVPHPEYSEEALRKELEMWIEHHLKTLERPKALRFVTTIRPDWAEPDAL